MPVTSARSSLAALFTRTAVSVPSSSTVAASPIAMIRNGPPNPEAWATSASATTDAEVTVRWMVIRLSTSDQV